MRRPIDSQRGSAKYNNNMESELQSRLAEARPANTWQVHELRTVGVEGRATCSETSPPDWHSDGLQNRREHVINHGPGWRVFSI